VLDIKARIRQMEMTRRELTLALYFILERSPELVSQALDSVETENA
jgi:hypothetical protein